MGDEPTIAAILADVGPRLRRLRTGRGLTLADLAAVTGISKSTLSRLETGQRAPSLELLLPIAFAHRVPLDELVGVPELGDPRIRLTPRVRNGRVVVPLTPQPRGAHAWKLVILPERGERVLRTHDGAGWIYVLAGELRLLVGDDDVTVPAGEAVEFDTRLPHWFGAGGDEPVEILSLLGRQGQPLTVRVAGRRAAGRARR